MTVYINGVAIVDGATKEFYVNFVGGTTPHTAVNRTGYKIDQATDTAYAEFSIPADFTSLDSLEVVFIAIDTITARLNVISLYSADTEIYNTHTETDADIDTAITGNRVYVVATTGLLANAVAGDIVGIQVLGDAVNVPDLFVVGIRVKYS